MKIYSFCITFTPTACVTKDITTIHHVYKPDYSSLRIFFCPDRKLGPVFHQIGAVFGRVFFLVNVFVIKSISHEVSDRTSDCFNSCKFDETSKK